MSDFHGKQSFLQLNLDKMQMLTKNLLVSIVAIVTVLALVSVASAWPVDDNGLVDGGITVQIDGVYASEDPSVVAGDTITVKVKFTAENCDQEVTVEAELEGDKSINDASDVSDVFDVETNKTYQKVLTLKVPFELKDSRSDDLELTITIDGKEYKAVSEIIPS